MSIVRCDECEKTMDIDKEETRNIFGHYWLCIHCYEDKIIECD